MSLAVNNKILASDFIAIKARVKAECLRRKYFGTVESYGGTAYDYTTTPAVGNPVKPEHVNKLIVPINAISSTGLSEVKAGDVIKSIEALDTKLTELEAYPVYGTGSGCSSNCTGLCTTTCGNTCEGCTGGCTSCTGTCSDTCTGTCNTTCTGTCNTNCNGCTGTCTGCTSCTSCTSCSSCSGCSGSCVSQCARICTGCSGTCGVSCSGLCTGGCYYSGK